EQFYVFWQSGWIDDETWNAWDRWLRELYIGQSPGDTISQGRTDAYKGRNLNQEDACFSRNAFLLFEEFWNEVQNRRYYRKAFREYVDGILTDARNNLPSLLKE
ncbi:MAG: hypothetical protein HW412_2385, partial [Bacteroidetes bacterium]|nr:hypothetical protein [Bacteroidota bacterium]